MTPLPYVVALVAAAPAAGPQAAIEAALADSTAGWNAGDLNRFVAIYADDATFVSGDAIARGKAEITARYAKGFAAGGTPRGTLSLRPVAWRPLSSVHVLLVGRWTLTAADGTSQSGHTTLLFERRKTGWRIISDHS